MDKKPPKNLTRDFGRRGETAARAYLLGRGYEILGANLRLGRKEIDLVAKQGGQTVFVEVKTRRIFPEPGSSPLSQRQGRNLKLAIAAYAIKNRLPLEAARLDLIIISDRPAELRHYRDIFNY